MLRTTDSDCSPLTAKKNPEEYARRCLYVRLPHSIKTEKEVEEHLVGKGYRVKLTRQTARHCVVEFPSLEEKLRNLKALKGKLINGKPIIARRITPNVTKKTNKKPQKKIRVPEIKPDLQITQTLFLTNIKCGTSAQEVKEALTGCRSIKFLKAYNRNCRSAVAKMENLRIAREYLTQKKECPEIQGLRIKVHPDTRRRHKKKKKLKINILGCKAENNETD